MNHYMCDRFNKIIATHPIDTIFINYFTLAQFFESILLNTNKKLFIHIHGYDITADLRSHDNPTTCRYSTDYLKSICNISQKATIIANSNFTKNQLLEMGVIENHIIVKYFGVPVSDHPPIQKQNQSQLEILFLGRLVDCKGPDIVMQAFDLACQQGLNAHLTIAGDGPLRITCELLKRRLLFGDRISLLGYVDESTSQQLREKADIFTAHNCLGPLTHQEEGFGVSIIEAMAAALPVITGRSGGVNESVVDGHTGILIEPGDIMQHANAFLLLQQNGELRYSLGIAGWQRVRQKFTIQQEKIKLTEIFGIF